MAEQLKILKRSYLTIAKGPLKDSMLSAKRWCVLVTDLSTGNTRMDFFRDEKSASKGEQCRNSLNVASVVEAQRVTEKRQTFELLCPGVSHRFQANSEAETDDWVADIKNLIVYRKDTSPSRSLSLPATTHHQPYNPHSNLPTPPETQGYLMSAPIPVGSHKQSVFFRSNSQDSPHNPFPSPNSSGDSSSLNSMSTGSMETHNRFQPASEGGDIKLPYKGIRVRVKENDKLPIFGDCDLAVEDDTINLYRPGQNVLVASWHIGTLRRYGVNKVCFTIDVGRSGTTGLSRFFFYTHQSSVIYSEVHKIAQRIEAMCKEDTPNASSLCRDQDSVSGITSVTSMYSRLNNSFHSSGTGTPFSGTNGHTCGPLSHDSRKSSFGSLVDEASVYPSSSKLPACPPRTALIYTPSSPMLKSSSLPSPESNSGGRTLISDPLEGSPQGGNVSTCHGRPPPLPPKPQMSEDDDNSMYVNTKLPLKPPPRTVRSTGSQVDVIV